MAQIQNRASKSGKVEKRILTISKTKKKIIANLSNRFFIFDKEPVLFNTTIKENILYGTKEQVSEKELRSACKEANALEFIENFTEKFETNVGPGMENEIFFVS